MERKNKSFYIIALLVTWLLGCIFQYFFCCKQPVVKKAVTKKPVAPKVVKPKAKPPVVEKKPAPVVAVKKVTKHPFAVKGKGLGVKIAGQDNFNFFADKAAPIVPVTEQLQGNVKKLTDYLGENDHRQLLVTGLYHPKEKNMTIFPNLGVARANQVKEYLVGQGADTHQIKIAGKAYEKSVSDKDNKYFGMAEFSIKELGDDHLKSQAAKMKQLADEIKANPITLYFKTGNSDIRLTTEQRDALFNMVRYLNFDDDAKIAVIGHTDNVGKAGDNKRLGTKRASVVADYLVTKGLKKDRMTVTSVGASEPIADNATEEGRAKNRRVVISIMN